MSFQEEELWEEESDSHCHLIVRRMALFHLSSPRSPGDTLMKQLVREDAGEAWQEPQVQGLASFSGTPPCAWYFS